MTGPDLSTLVGKTSLQEYIEKFKAGAQIFCEDFRRILGEGVRDSGSGMAGCKRVASEAIVDQDLGGRALSIYSNFFDCRQAALGSDDLSFSIRMALAHRPSEYESFLSLRKEAGPDEIVERCSNFAEFLEDVLILMGNDKAAN